MRLCSSLSVFQRKENVHLASESELVQHNARLSGNVGSCLKLGALV